ncbi:MULTISPECIES: arylsulfatase [unclassified Pseudomonas]|uniref:arylsulfatase n=1 Tax=unclassified Pseudomonas TaxID=196821 RepID=UPI002448E816|nr:MULTISPECIES: arylsulfatase [unclassified Pseudomonas]MDG9925686.1 arylsulfatase [Pseudomonas sp. GD04045]MDH0037197.1 arylsulfatase [Pseudomonas sp. GD04019]
MKRTILALAAVAAIGAGGPTQVLAQTEKPNIVVIWGDDIGVHNVSAYNLGVMGYQTPNIDRIGKEGMQFTHAYAQNSCTAGRASFILGQHPFRTGLLTIGMPGSEHGIPDWTPTIADLLKEQGYATGQFGKNHLGDRDKHLPTKHGFDEFFGNLYHLNAEEEPEGYYYPKDPEFRKKFGPRGVIHATADGKIEDTGPLTSKRMETIDEEVHTKAMDFLERQVKADKPVFMWYNTTRMHIWTHLKKESVGKTGVGLYPDGMVEHDGYVGQVLDKLDELGIADNTIVIYSTDNGAESVSWPDGGITPFMGEKGSTWEGGFRVPMMVRWPGKIKPGQISDAIISQEDWMPTLVAAAGEADVVEKLKKGYKANGRDFKVHPDGYNFVPFLTGENKESPRKEIYYFGQGGELNAVRVGDWKIHFATVDGNIATGTRKVTSWPLIINLKADPYEKMWEEGSLGYLRWYADQMWTFVPVQQKLQQFMATIPEYPYQSGESLNAAGISYQTLKVQEVMQRLKTLSPPRN